MESLVRAGEPGVALENLATQLDEYEVPVEQRIIDEVTALGKAMNLDEKEVWGEAHPEVGAPLGRGALSDAPVVSAGAVGAPRRCTAQAPRRDEPAPGGVS